MNERDGHKNMCLERMRRAMRLSMLPRSCKLCELGPCWYGYKPFKLPIDTENQRGK